jgi:hypothetical protein
MRGATSSEETRTLASGDHAAHGHTGPRDIRRVPADRESEIRRWESADQLGAQTWLDGGGAGYFWGAGDVILAQLAGGYTFTQIAIAIVVIAIVCGIVLIVLRVSGINLPQWVWAILGLIALGIVAIFGIRMVAGQ